MPRMASTDEIEDYQENRLCPYCYAEEIEKDATSWEGQTLKQTMYCTKCEMRWTEIYTMTGLYLDEAED